MRISESSRLQVNRYVFFLTLFSTLIFIFSHSLAPAAESGAVSETVFTFLDRILGFLPFFSHAFVRKLAHFAEYALLGVHTCAALPLFFGGKYRKLWLPMLLSVPVALIDEGIQLFVAGRAGLWTDVLIDCGGILFGALMALLFMVLCKKRKEKAH